MKKRILFLITILILLTGCVSTTKKVEEKTPEYIEELKGLGYTNEVIEKLKEKLNEEELKQITAYDYIDIILDIINDEYFQVENLEKYLKYYEEGMNGKAVVYIMNNNIKYTYNEKLVAIMKHPYFIAKNLDRYMTYQHEDIDTIIRNVNSNIDREFYTDIKQTDTSKGYLLITNKFYQLEENYHYKELVTIPQKYTTRSGQKLSKEALEAFKSLVDDGEKEGVYIRNLSAYRSYNTQNNLYTNYKKEHGDEWADKWSARPGHSEHQTGLALDVTTKEKVGFDEFEKTKEFSWLKENAYNYGFILRYPNDKINITGYGYEPWHYRYVGIDAATYIYENDITYEEYYAYFVETENEMEEQQ